MSQTSMESCFESHSNSDSSSTLSHNFESNDDDNETDESTFQFVSLKSDRASPKDVSIYSVLCDFNNLSSFGASNENLHTSLLLLNNKLDKNKIFGNKNSCRNQNSINAYDFYCSSDSSLMNQTLSTDESSDEYASSATLLSAESSKPNETDLNKVALSLLANIKRLIESYGIDNRNAAFYNEKSSTVSDENSSIRNNTSTISKYSSTDLENENFVDDLFAIIFAEDYKFSKLEQFQNDLESNSHIPKDLFMILAKISSEFFDLKMYALSECLLRLALDRIDTDSLQLKMANICLLGACYWRMQRFSDCINCLNLEFTLNNSIKSDLDFCQYNQNRYKIYGNLACAHEQLNNFAQCLSSFKLQLQVAYELNASKLIIASLNSIGFVYCRLKRFQNAIDYFENSFALIFDDKEAKLRQLSLVGECYLKLGNFLKAKQYFEEQLRLLDDLEPDCAEENRALKLVCLSNLSTAEFNLKNVHTSIDLHETCLEILIAFDKENRSQITTELYGAVYLGLINGFICLNETSNAAIYSQQLIDFVLSRLNHIDKNNKTFYNYLKYLEMTAYFKLAQCHTIKQEDINAALKLHEKEALIAKQLNNALFLCRALSNMAQIYFLNKTYDIAIVFYKKIFKLIKKKLDKVSQQNWSKKEIRYAQILYFTLSNLAISAEQLNKNEDATMYFEEQLDISSILDENFRSQTLLNLTRSMFKSSTFDHQKMLVYLNELFSIYRRTNDLHGQLFVCQFCAFIHQLDGELERSIEFYTHLIGLSKSIGRSEILEKCLFNMSILYKALKQYEKAYEYQTEFFNMSQHSALNQILSLGVLSDLLILTNRNEADLLRECVKLNLDRLKLLIKCSSEKEENLSKFVFDSLEKIAYCYHELGNFDECLKLKLLELSLAKKTGLVEPQRIMKLCTELGDLCLFKMNRPNKALKYYAKSLNLSQTNQVSLKYEALLLGNSGICMQKLGDFKSSVSFFRRQLKVLSDILSKLDETRYLRRSKCDDSNNSSSFVSLEPKIHPFLDLSDEKTLESVREIILVRLNIARSYSKLSKSYQMCENLIESLNCAHSYAQECKYLYKVYSQSYFYLIDMKTKPNDVNNSFFVLVEQIYIDYETSLLKLSDANQSLIDGTQQSIEINEFRLQLRTYTSKYLNELKSHDSDLVYAHAYFSLARLYFDSHNVDKSVENCEKFIEFYEKNQHEIDKDANYVRLIYFYSDLLVLGSSDENQFAIKLFALYDRIWRTDFKSIKEKTLLDLKFDLSCKLIAMNEKQGENLVDQIEEILMKFCSILENNDSKCSILIDYVYQLNLKVALVYFDKYETQICTQTLKWCKEFLHQTENYLTNLNSLIGANSFNARLGFIKFLQGKCAKHNQETNLALEMLADSLDLLENVAQSKNTLEHNRYLFGQVVDDESFISRQINDAYECLIECLIEQKKHKEAILVIERFKSNFLCPYLLNLPELFSFSQIEHFLENHINESIIYFYNNQSKKELAYWLIDRRGFNFDQLKYDRLSESFVCKILAKSLNESNESIYLIYDEALVHVSFHLLKTNSCKYAFETHSIDCIYSLRFLLRNIQPYVHRYIKHAKQSERNSSVKLIAKEDELDRLLNESGDRVLKYYKFNLVIIVLNVSENKKNDPSLLNNLINNLFCRSITKSVLIVHSYADENDDLDSIHEHLKVLCSKLSNIICLNPCLIFEFIVETFGRNEFERREFLLFGKSDYAPKEFKDKRIGEGEDEMERDECLKEEKRSIIENSLNDMREIKISKTKKIEKEKSIPIRIDQGLLSQQNKNEFSLTVRPENAYKMKEAEDFYFCSVFESKTACFSSPAEQNYCLMTIFDSNTAHSFYSHRFSASNCLNISCTQNRNETKPAKISSYATDV